MYRFASLLFLCSLLSDAAQPPSRWSVYEVQLTAGKQYTNPYAEASVTAEFRKDSGPVFNVRGFWDGGKTFKLRFTPTEAGRWTYVTRSSDPGLNGKRGAIEVGPARPATHGFIRIDPENRHHWVHDDGTRVFLFGQTYYEIVSAAREGDAWKQAVDRSLEHGLNKVRFRIHIKTCGGKDNPAPCRQWWSGDKDHLDLTHFEALDRVIEYLNERGVVADVMPFDSSADAYGTPEQDSRFLDYVLARYAAYPNVIWCITNEYQRAHREKAYLNTLGAALRKADPWMANGNKLRGLSIHPLGGIGNGDRWHFDDQVWPTHVILQIGRWTPGDPKLYKVQVSNREFNMPVVNDEFGYMGDSLWRDAKGDRSNSSNWYSRENHRRSMWAIYMAGTYASTGDKNLYPDGRPYKSSRWHDQPEYGDIRALVALFTTKGLDYWRMQPSPEVVRSGERVYCLAYPGEQYIFYAAAGGEFTAAVAPGRYAVRLFNPRDGSERESPEVRGGGPSAISVPPGEDWAVYLKAIR